MTTTPSERTLRWRRARARRLEAEQRQREAARKDAARKAAGERRRERLAIEEARAARGTTTFRHGDALGLVRELADASVALVLTDPPYGIAYQSGYRWASSTTRIAGDEALDGAVALLGAVLAALEPKLRADAHLLCFCDARPAAELAVASVAEQAGWTIRRRVTWAKPEGGMGDLAQTFAPADEPIIHATTGKARLRRRETSVIHSPRGGLLHPTEKPLELLNALIRATTEPGDLVVDPFAGVASTLVAARDAGRDAWGAELDERYHQRGMERLA